MHVIHQSLYSNVINMLIFKMTLLPVFPVVLQLSNIQLKLFRTGSKRSINYNKLLLIK